MKDTSEILLARMDRLRELMVLAQCAALEDRAYLKHKIELAGWALLAVAQAQEAVRRASRLMEEAEADVVCRRGELALLTAQLRVMNDRISK
jgi:hypothetical protein